jgi:hypothetical protein
MTEPTSRTHAVPREYTWDLERYSPRRIWEAEFRA